MRLKAETFHTYRGAIQTKEKNLKPGQFCPGGLKLGMESYFVYFSRKSNPLLNVVES
jgi:hypothetical protein